ncbi:S41 family peptidase [Candidatus Parcubacteria bacterium]|nr:S41 family peptidase [Candidatus Parcubacteria bacterium]
MKNNFIEKIHKFSWFNKPLALYLVLVLLIVSFGAGMMIGKKQGKLTIVTEPEVVKNEAQEEYGKVTGKESSLPEYLKNEVNFSLFWEVWNKIQTEYIGRPVGETELLYGAASGLVSALQDPYSIFLPPEPAKEFKDDLQGKFEGIGAEIGIRDKLLTIISPLPESPAEKAGLKPKDRIIEIDGQSTENIFLNEAVTKIRGEKGTSVVLKVFRESDNSFHEITIIRDTIKIVSVRWEMKDEKIAYIRITNFNSDTDIRLRKIVDEVILKNPQGIILDLRNNPGGYLDRSATAASYWLSAGTTVVFEESANGDKKQYLANGQAQLKDYPTVVLVNSGSASASEIVAGALQDYKIASIIGETTFGKGSVQNLSEFSDGSAIKLTIARWLTPNGRQIDLKGIEPDVEVEITEEEFKDGKDPQIDKAIEILNNL